MGHSLILWTASLLAPSISGQVIVAPADSEPKCGCQAGQASGQPSTGFFDRLRGTGQPNTSPANARFQPVPDGSVQQQDSKPTILGRLKERMSGLFGRQTPPNSMELGMPVVEPTAKAYAPLQIHQAASTNEPPLNQPAGKIVQTGYAPSQPMPAQAVQSGPNLGVILPKYVNRIGHEEDFSWVTGQLGSENGHWVIHYATPDTVDNFHGKLVLMGNVNMTGYQLGDLISVQGGLTAQSGRLSGVYQVHNISLIERK